ncbi:hypothetical protein BJX99DRAFT_68496 [Aspergillus californicus]
MSHEFQSCQSCLSLAATIMDLVVGLYAAVSLIIHPPANTDSEGSNDSNISAGSEKVRKIEIGKLASSVTIAQGVPMFKFGCVEFDPDEQEIFLNAMMRRYSGRCIETIRHCSREVRRRQQPGSQQTGTAVQHECFQSTRSCTDRVQLQWYQISELSGDSTMKPKT